METPWYATGNEDGGGSKGYTDEERRVQGRWLKRWKRRRWNVVVVGAATDVLAPGKLVISRGCRNKITRNRGWAPAI